MLAMCMVAGGIVIAMGQQPRNQGPASDARLQPDQAAIRDYVLTMDKVKRYARLLRTIEASKKDLVLRREVEALRSEVAGKSLTETVTTLERFPKISNMIRAAGLTPRDYVLLPMTILSSGMAMYVEQQGGKRPPYVNPANIKFIKEHEAEISALDLSSKTK